MIIRHSRIVLDACCMINLHASGRLAEIILTLPVPVVVTEVVRTQELLSVSQLDRLNPPEYSFQALVAQGIIEITDFETEAEQIDYLNYAALFRQDDEAASCAIAASRRYAIATDDGKARAVAAYRLPHLQVISTLELVRHWAEAVPAQASDLQETLQNIRTHGRYAPASSHPLYAWWQQALGKP